MRCVRRRQLQDHGRQRPVHTLRPAQVQRLDVALRQLSPPYPVFCRLCQHRQLRVRARSVRGRDRLHALVPPEHVPERGKPNELQGLPARQLPGSLRSEASSCVSCPANSAISPPGPGVALSNCSCIVSYSGPDGGPCAVCVAGSYKSVAGEAACEQCPADSYAAAGSSACDAFPDSSSAACSQALANCTCAAGYEARANPFFCAACAAGSVQPAAANTVRDKMLPDAVPRHVDLQMLAERSLHVRDEFMQMHAVRVVRHVGHDLVIERVLAACVRTQRTAEERHCLFVAHRFVLHEPKALNKKHGSRRISCVRGVCLACVSEVHFF